MTSAIKLTKTDGRAITVYFNENAIEDTILDAQDETVQITLSDKEFDEVVDEANAHFKEKYENDTNCPAIRLHDFHSSSVRSFYYHPERKDPWSSSYDIKYNEKLKVAGTRIHLSHDRSYAVLETADEIREHLLSMDGAKQGQVDMHESTGKERYQQYLAEAKESVHKKLQENLYPGKW